MSLFLIENAYYFLTGGKCAVSLLERCISYIGVNASECVKTTSFLNLSKESITKLISSDYVSESSRSRILVKFAHTVYSIFTLSLHQNVRSFVWRKKMYGGVYLHGLNTNRMSHNRQAIGQKMSVHGFANTWLVSSIMFDYF